jgi:proline dehydrogenase
VSVDSFGIAETSSRVSPACGDSTGPCSSAVAGSSTGDRLRSALEDRHDRSWSAASVPSLGIIRGVSVALIARRVLLALATSAGWQRAVRAVPGGGRAAYRLARGYVAGTGSEDALSCAHRLAAAGLASSIDCFGDNVSDPIEADRVSDQYVALAGRLEQAPENTFLSIDLSHIGLDQPADAVQQRLERIASALPAGRRIQVGAEQERRADRVLAAVSAVARRGGAVSATIHANLKRSRVDGQALAESGVPIRLVKGAYAEDPRSRGRGVNRPTWPLSSLPTSCMQTARTSPSPPTTPSCVRRSCAASRASASRCCSACAGRTRRPSPPGEYPSGSTCPTGMVGSATRWSLGRVGGPIEPTARSVQLATRGDSPARPHRRAHARASARARFRRPQSRPRASDGTRTVARRAPPRRPDRASPPAPVSGAPGNAPASSQPSAR